MEPPCRRGGEGVSDIMTLIAAIEWIAVGIVCFIGLRRWNKRFAALYDELKKMVEEEPT